MPQLKTALIMLTFTLTWAVVFTATKKTSAFTMMKAPKNEPELEEKATWKWLWTKHV